MKKWGLIADRGPTEIGIGVPIIPKTMGKLRIQYPGEHEIVIPTLPTTKVKVTKLYVTLEDISGDIAIAMANTDSLGDDLDEFLVNWTLQTPTRIRIAYGRGEFSYDES